MLLLKISFEMMNFFMKLGIKMMNKDGSYFGGGGVIFMMLIMRLWWCDLNKVEVICGWKGEGC